MEPFLKLPPYSVPFSSLSVLNLSQYWVCDLTSYWIQWPLLQACHYAVSVLAHLVFSGGGLLCDLSL